ncbi:MAG: L-histidine N(alpha)-methyltransferase [Cryomorphaceae bacterium]|nr:L-histidine N(alpha)-methyltransferase [Cryomorphaceae bacterium]
MEQEIIQLLSQPKKSLPSKYFYDKKGDALFQSIMEMPEYYLTRSEFEIFQNQSNAIFSAFNPNVFSFTTLLMASSSPCSVVEAYPERSCKGWKIEMLITFV